MGDSSVTCVFTGLTLHEADAYFIPLVPADNGGCGLTGARIVSNEGSRALFNPLTLPIKGSTGCYGSMETIHRDDHTQFLEKALGVKIHEFVEACENGSNFCDDLNEDLKGMLDSIRHWDGALSGCYVEAGAYEKFSRFYRDDCGGTIKNAYNGAWPGPHLLRAVGFVEGEKNQARSVELLGHGPQAGDRYHTPWVHPEMPSVTLWSDQHMTVRIEFNGRIVGPVTAGRNGYLSSTHFFDDIETAIRQRGVEFPESIKAFLTSKSLNWGSIRETLDNFRETLDNFREYKGHGLKSLARGFSYRLPISEVGLRIYGDSVCDYEDEFAALSQFLLNMFACNRLLMPTIGGFQYGNHYMVHEVSKYTAAKAKSKFAKDPYNPKFAVSVSPKDDDRFIAKEKARVEAYYKSIGKR